MFYSKLLSSVCEGVLTSPTTGEKYGGTDFVNPCKLYELQAIPLSESDGDIPKNPVQTGTIIKISEDGLSATRIKTWRSKTENELKFDFDIAYNTLFKSVNVIRSSLLESLIVSIDINNNKNVMFNANEFSRNSISNKLISIFNGSSTSKFVEWRDYNNNIHNLNLNQLQLLCNKISSSVDKIMKVSWYIKDFLLPEIKTIDKVLEFNMEKTFQELIQEKFKEM